MPLKSPVDMRGAAWVPDPQRIATSNMNRFCVAMEARWGRSFDDYDALHAWSVEHLDEFWSGLWDFAGIVAQAEGERVLEQGATMESVRWFPDARLNFAENLLRFRGDADALVFWGEDKVKRRLSRDELYAAVARVAAALRARGVKAGDRVVAYMPNSPDTIVAMLAAASIGAIFSSASPDFGPQGIIDRFGQIEPVVLFATDGYHYNGRPHSCLGKLHEIADQLPTVHTVVICPYLGLDNPAAGICGAVTLDELTADHATADEIRFEQLPFDHPLYIVFSSGTTGVPKCIVHRAGGALTLHLKEHQLHGNIRDGSRLFYFATCSWVMWNWLASGLASGAALMLYDGSPFAADNHILFDYMQAERFTHFGTSAKFIEACAKLGLEPGRTHQTGSVEVLYSTGSPLMAEGYDYIHRAFKRDVHIASISGGTDLLGAFVGGNPVLPVWAGEIQCKQLGMAADVVDEDGHPVKGRKGELVCTRPFTTQPLYFWADPEGHKYHEAYFSRFEGIWCHGDFCEVTPHGGYIIYGRSDATLNPGGVRIGTAEIYRQVDQIGEVVESAVIGQNWPPEKPTDVRVVLFVRLRDGLTLDEDLSDRIKQQIRVSTTPRHVPSRVVQVADIPRTKSGKIVELAIRQVVHGEAVKNTGALANPEALEHFRARAELAT
ncbi:acetoacetate--CoA ligase [Aromatoleum aromaticum]|uniref:acetoacetate--CoA ligase n=1 Tax=Aromatoleum aromaticum TaxID=551760 RepID=UPI0016B53B4A|nr:acetoacetate--CoA ligase [Aromatoleum aromaticum]NMG56361.1 acetoacetate--CoA ligase [Aromatoleum aromaticum]